MSDAPKELYFYDDWLAQHTKGKLLCGNNRYLHADHVDALLKAERKAGKLEGLREAAETVDRVGPRISGDAILALIEKDATDG